jgi:hypothetical protein
MNAPATSSAIPRTSAPPTESTPGNPPRRRRREHDDQPWRSERTLRAYAVLIALFNGLFGVFLVLSKITGRQLPSRMDVADMVVVGVATHQMSRLISRDMVTTVVRAPFTRVEGHAELPGELEEVAQGRGWRRAMGELLSCPYCIGAWIAAFFSYGLVLAPSPTRLIAGAFASLTLSDFLHAAYRLLNNVADRLSEKG